MKENNRKISLALYISLEFSFVTLYYTRILNGGGINYLCLSNFWNLKRLLSKFVDNVNKTDFDIFNV